MTRKLTLMLSIVFILLVVLPLTTAQQTKDIIKVNSDGAEEYRMERLAVVVGVNEYFNGKVSNLKYAVSDAEKMAKVLDEQGVFDVQLLTTDSDVYPVKDNIIQALKDADYLASRGLIKSFVFYFSGHGFQQDGENYLAPMDVRPDDLKGTGIKLDYVLDIVDEIQENAKVMVFMDACRNDPGGTKSMGSGFARDEESHGFGVFYSTSPGDYSWEVGRLDGGVYTYYLVEALYGGADSRPIGNGDGYITFSEATAYVTYAMRQWTRENPDMRQIPWESTNKTGEFFITMAGDYVPPVDDDDDIEPVSEVEELRDVEYREMVSVDGGTFVQSGIDYNKNKGSFGHKVSSFDIGKYEVTYELWYKVYLWAIFNDYEFENSGREGHNGSDGSSPTSSKHEPVTEVNWRDAIVWCNAYSEMSGYKPVYRASDDSVIKNSNNGSECDDAEPDWSANGYRLPTEGEWQFAASDRGSTPWDYASGASDDYKNSSATGRVGWYGDNSGRRTHAVGTKDANVLGLHDMSGNVWEWCWDWKDDYPTSAREDYTGPSSGSYRVSRGGCWSYRAEFLRVGYRYCYRPYGEDYYMGFRVARRP